MEKMITENVSSKTRVCWDCEQWFRPESDDQIRCYECCEYNEKEPEEIEADYRRDQAIDDKLTGDDGC